MTRITPRLARFYARVAGGCVAEDEAAAAAVAEDAEDAGVAAAAVAEDAGVAAAAVAEVATEFCDTW